jgi:hypothetical protein
MTPQQDNDRNEQAALAKLERHLGAFPEIVARIRTDRAAGLEDLSQGSVTAIIADKWGVSLAHQREAKNTVRHVASDIWPRQTSREGRAKFSDYAQFDLFADVVLRPKEGGPTWKEVACRAYAVTLADGSTGHRCAFTMTNEQRTEAIETLEKQHTELGHAVGDLKRVDRDIRKMRIPGGMAPSDYYPPRKKAA